LTVTGVTYAEFGPKGKGLGSWMNDQWIGRKPEGTFDVEDLAVALIRFEGGLTINLKCRGPLTIVPTVRGARNFGSEGGGDWGQRNRLVSRHRRHNHHNYTNLPSRKILARRRKPNHFVQSYLNKPCPDRMQTQGVTLMEDAGRHLPERASLVAKVGNQVSFLFHSSTRSGSNVLSGRA
jgi:hypothetical protein